MDRVAINFVFDNLFQLAHISGFLALVDGAEGILRGPGVPKCDKCDTLYTGCFLHWASPEKFQVQKKVI